MNTGIFATAVTSLRILGAGIAAIASVALSCLFVANALHFWRFTDAEFTAQLRNASYMDILGFGFWPTWVVAALMQVGFWFVLWALLRQAKQLGPIIVSLLLIAFMAASVFDYRETARIERLLGVTSTPASPYSASHYSFPRTYRLTAGKPNHSFKRTP